MRPAGLDDGLSPALRELASRSPLRIRVEATDERFEDTLETAAYFVASEALTNAAKHARASQITVNAARRNGHLVVRVHDDGIGGALAADGSGLTGMRIVSRPSVEACHREPGRRRNTDHGGVAMRVVIAEDQVLLRDGLARLFNDAGHQVVAAVDDGDRLRGAVSEHQPDLAVVDVRMPPSFKDEGIRAARWIRDTHPSVGVLVLSQHIESAGAVSLVSQGGFGYLLKDRVLDVSAFLEAAERVAGGGSALDPKVVASLVGGDPDALEALTEREREVLALMAEGLTNIAIARRLVSPNAPSKATSATCW